MGGKQDDFIFRYQPGLGGEDIELIHYLKSFAPKRRKKMILMALRAFWEVEALKNAKSTPEMVQQVGEVNVDTLERRLHQLRQSLDLQTSSSPPEKSQKNLNNLNQSHSDPQPTYNYRSLGMSLGNG